jgi:hypothetical protein
MAGRKEPNPEKTAKELPAISRQSRAPKEIDKMIQSDEPAGKKLKKIVEEQSEACEEVARELAARREGTTPESFPPPLHFQPKKRRAKR